LPVRWVAADLRRLDRPLPAPADGLPLVAVDPELGRFRFADPRQVPERLRVSVHVSASPGLGGGFYARPRAEAEPAAAPEAVLRVGDHNDPRLAALGPELAPRFQSLDDALLWLQEDWPAGGLRQIEILDSRSYHLSLHNLELPASGRLVLRAADRQRPLLVLDGDLDVQLPAEAALVLEGLWLAGGGLRVVPPASEPASGGLRRVALRDCTLIPPYAQAATGVSAASSAVSLDLASSPLELQLERCILGPLRVEPGIEAALIDSIVDAGPGDSTAAYSARSGALGGLLRSRRCTLLGAVQVEEIEAVDTLFMGRVSVQSTQHGWLRFCWAPPESRVPRRYGCQPDLSSAAHAPAAAARLRARLTPRFVSRHYGAAGYGQLDRSNAPGILRGAEDGGEMGACARLERTQREDELRTQLREFVPLGLDSILHFCS
jgi:hypothetical protein